MGPGVVSLVALTLGSTIMAGFVPTWGLCSPLECFPFMGVLPQAFEHLLVLGLSQPSSPFSLGRTHSLVCRPYLLWNHLTLAPLDGFG